MGTQGQGQVEGTYTQGEVEAAYRLVRLHITTLGDVVAKLMFANGASLPAISATTAMYDAITNQLSMVERAGNVHDVTVERLIP